MQSVKTMEFMPKPESSSFVERRQLFKNIWDTAMSIDEKDDNMNKPKVIKTLRLEEMDKLIVGKSKKQRIKDLRHVCKRILDYCDKHDAEDTLYEQVQVEDQASPTGHVIEEIKSPKKIKTHKKKRKVKKAMSLAVQSPEPALIKGTISDDFTRNAEMETSRISTPSKINISSYMTNPIPKKKLKPKMRRKHSGAKSGAMTGDNKSRNSPTAHRAVKKRVSKRKKSAHEFSAGFVMRNIWRVTRRESPNPN